MMNLILPAIFLLVGVQFLGCGRNEPTVLTLGLVPVYYSLFFRVSFKDFEYEKGE